MNYQLKRFVVGLFGLLGLIIFLATSCYSSGSEIIEVTPVITIVPENSTPTVVSETPTPTVGIATSLSGTADLPTPTWTPTISPSPVSTSSPIPDYFSNWGLKVAYATFQDDGSSQIWLLREPTQSPQLILNLESTNGLLNDQLSWSHSGEFIAFTHLVDGDTVSVSKVNIENMEIQSLGFSYPLVTGDSNSSVAISLFPFSWSDDDRWLHASLSYIDPETRQEFRKDFILSTEGEEIIELEETVEFVAWSSIDPQQYLYISHPNHEGGETAVSIGVVGNDKPLKTISDLGEYAPGMRFHLAWSPDAAVAIATSFNGVTRNTSVVKINFQEERWQLLTYEAQGRSHPSLWSSNGQWLAFWQSSNLYLWEIEITDEPAIQVPLQTSYVTPLFWLRGEEFLLYLDGDVLYAIDPEQAQDPLPVLNVAALKIASTRQVNVNVWSSLRFP